METVIPELKVCADKLTRLYLKNPVRAKLDQAKMAGYDRKLENGVKLFREENIPLQTKETKLAQQYQKICGAMSVNFNGEERTLIQLAKYMEENDRKIREEVWLLANERRLQDKQSINKIFDEQLTLRCAIAENAGFNNYRDYKHQAYNRFDYQPSNCEEFHLAVEEVVVPILKAQRIKRKELLGLDSLRPWDLAVDAKGRAALKPFKDADELEEKCAKLFHCIDNKLGSQFEKMRAASLLDLANRKGKAPGGYNYPLGEIRMPFIFMNATGTNQDVFTLLHEGGHAFHTFASRDHQLADHRDCPLEFCEVASMAMEAFALGFLDNIYSSEELIKQAKQNQIESIISTLPWVATIDAFQHWIYLNPKHSIAERDQKFIEIWTRFSPEIDWSGLEKFQPNRWQQQLHIFINPFYYIEYGIAQLGALQLWMKYKQQPQQALDNYLKALALGGTRSLPELFKASGADFDFTAKTMQPALAALAAELDSVS